jgi:hypothetical protein
MAVSKKILCVLLSVIVVGIALSARFLCLPAKAMSLDNSITSQMQSDSPKENPNNITTAEIETYFSQNGLDYYAYMDISSAPDELVPVILEARSRIISQTSWVADDLNGWVEDCDGNIIEIVPKFHEIFPQDWEIPLDYGKLDD